MRQTHLKTAHRSREIKLEMLIDNQAVFKYLLKNDVLVQIKEIIPLDGAVSAKVKLPFQGDHIEPSIGTVTESTRPSICHAVGWGLTEHRRQSPVILSTEVEVFSHGACNATNRYPGKVDRNSEFCAGQIYGQNDVCGGDSGGPLVCYKNGTLIQYGVVSWGYGCGKPDKPGVYAKVSAVVDWITASAKG